jgi:hypothetical protein
MHAATQTAVLIEFAHPRTTNHVLWVVHAADFEKLTNPSSIINYMD